MARRVVVTGMGVASPLGIGVRAYWDSLLRNENGIKKIENMNLRGEMVKIAAIPPIVDYQNYLSKDHEFFMPVPEEEALKASLVAVYEALNQAGVDPRVSSRPS